MYVNVKQMSTHCNSSSSNKQTQVHATVGNKSEEYGMSLPSPERPEARVECDRYGAGTIVAVREPIPETLTRTCNPIKWSQVVFWVWSHNKVTTIYSNYQFSKTDLYEIRSKQSYKWHL